MHPRSGCYKNGIRVKLRPVEPMLCPVEPRWSAHVDLLLPLDIPVWKWDEISMDFVTGLPRTQKKNDAIWVVVDRLTKSAHFLPIRKDFSISRLADIFQQEIVRLHGIPAKIVSDRDLRFTSRVWKGLQSAWGTRLKFSTAAPYELLYGRKCRAPIYWNEVGKRVIEGPVLIEVTNENVAVAKEKLKEAKSRQKSYADRHMRCLEFNPGDRVFLKVSSCRETMVEVPYTAEHNVFAVETQHSEQPENMNDTSLMEKVDSNTTPDSSDRGFTCEHFEGSDRSLSGSVLVGKVGRVFKHGSVWMHPRGFTRERFEGSDRSLSGSVLVAKVGRVFKHGSVWMHPRVYSCIMFRHLSELVGIPLFFSILIHRFIFRMIFYLAGNKPEAGI
nr:putative reverse transcriptase domain-containing protein [Tanacetum cinerariifolium]